MIAARSLPSPMPLVLGRRRRSDGREAEVSPGLRLAVGGLVVVLLGLELWARANDYGLRLISDTPTYVSLLYRLAAHPLQAVSPYFASGYSYHATPDLQLMALLWRIVHGTGTADPVAAYRLLALVGLGGTLLALHALFVWVRANAGSRAAWISLPVLLALLGPAHVIWAGDLSLNGFLYAGYFEQTLAVAIALYTLSVLDRASVRLFPLACLLVSLVLLMHPFTGVVLIALITLRSCRLAAVRRRDWWHGPVALAAGYAVAHAWPAFQVGAALSESGVSASVLLLMAVVAPCATWGIFDHVEVPTFEFLPRELSPRVTAVLAWAGVAGVAALAGWQLWLLYGVGPTRTGVYWVVGLGRWSLLLVAGLPGLAGLYALARRGRILPAAWFAAAYAIGVVGALGIHIALWYRILLFAQVPLALGVSLVAASSRSRSVRVAITVCVVGSLAVKAVTLLATPPTATYFGNDWLQPGYTLGSRIPPGQGSVASDPLTSYFLPAATGRSVITLTPAHLGSPAAVRQAEHGYSLLHQLYDGANWWQAAERLYGGGVRYVVVDHTLSLSSPTLEQFAADPPAVDPHGGLQRRLLGDYFYRLNRIGRLISDSPQYAVYRLDDQRLLSFVTGDAWSRDGRRAISAIPPDLTIASDPFTEYQLWRATGRPVLTLPPVHLRRPAAIQQSQHGYSLLHQLYEGANWWQAAKRLYSGGVRYVIVNHRLSLSPRTLERFTANPSIVNAAGGVNRRLLGVYFYRLNRVGRRLFDSAAYTVYRLDGRQLGVGGQ